MSKSIVVLAAAAAMLSATSAAHADDCQFEARNEFKQTFWWVRLVSRCEQQVTLETVKMNGRDECLLSPNKVVRLGDDFTFGIARNPDEAINMEVVKGITGLQYFDVSKCGQLVRLDLQTSEGMLTLEAE